MELEAGEISEQSTPLTKPQHWLHSDLIANEIVRSDGKTITVRIQFDSQRQQHEAFDISFDEYIHYHEFIWFIWLWNVRQLIQRVSLQEDVDLKTASRHQVAHLNVWIGGFDGVLSEAPSCTVTTTVFDVGRWMKTIPSWKSKYHYRDAARNVCDFHFFPCDKIAHLPVLVCTDQFRYWLKSIAIFRVINVCNL